MPNETATTPQGETPAAEAGQEPATPQTADAGQEPAEEFDAERARALIEKLRPFEKQAKQLEKELKAIKDAELSETERLKQQLEERDNELNEYRSQIRETRARDATVEAAKNAINPQAIWRMVRADVTYDDDGNPENLAPLIAGIQKDMPELFRSTNGSADGGAQGAGNSAMDINSLIRDMARDAR